jgi:hypothetical protein
MYTRTLGIFEKVDFPKLGIKSIEAKIDTGADTGSLHCTKVSVEKANGSLVLHFSPFDYPDIKVTTTDFRTKEVRSSNGDSEERYFVKTSISIHGETHPIEISLADRSAMKWPVLIGRKFLRENNFLVDVNLTKSPVNYDSGEKYEDSNII